MTTLTFPEAAHRLDVPVRTLRQAIRLGRVPAPADGHALARLSQEWFASVQMAVVSNPKALKVSRQKVPAFARYEGTSAFRDDTNRVREYNAHKARTAA